MNTTQMLSPSVASLGEKAFRIGGMALVVWLVGAVISPTAFFQGYLFGYVFWLNVALGSLGFLLIHHLVEGRWGFSIQRQLEAATRTILPMGALFVVVLIGMGWLYQWANPEIVAQDPLLQRKAIYLNRAGFFFRAIIYFAIWGGIAYFLNHWSKALDQPGQGSELPKKFEKLSGIGLVLFVLCVTFSSTDWVMSLEAHWFSTIYGLLSLVSSALSAMAFAILILQRLSEVKPISNLVKSEQFHDLGNLLLALVVLWAYINLSQFLIIWYGNLPEELPWYLHRIEGGWKYISILLIVAHFAFPFLLLLFRERKKNVHRLASVASWILVMRAVDHFWVVQPAFNSGFFGVLASAIGFVALGGIWLGLFVSELGKRPFIAEHDPRLKEAFHHHG